MGFPHLQIGQPGTRRGGVSGYVSVMKHTASSPNATTQQQNKDSRQNSGGAAAQGKAAGNAASASQRADAAAKRGEPLSANKQADRSPKQENL